MGQKAPRVMPGHHFRKMSVQPLTQMKKKALKQQCKLGEYVIIRSRDSGCHAGYLESERGTTITLTNARRIWYWAGAATLSQLATDGTSRPQACKFPCAVERITIYGVCEKLQVSAQAKASIERVPVWTA